MNDWYNDPPEEKELPSCPNCEDMALDYCETGVLVCAVCGYRVAVDTDWMEKPRGEAPGAKKDPFVR